MSPKIERFAWWGIAACFPGEEGKRKTPPKRFRFHHVRMFDLCAYVSVSVLSVPCRRYKELSHLPCRGAIPLINPFPLSPSRMNTKSTHPPALPPTLLLITSLARLSLVELLQKSKHPLQSFRGAAID